MTYAATTRATRSGGWPARSRRAPAPGFARRLINYAVTPTWPSFYPVHPATGPLDDDFERYERVYLDGRVKDIKPDPGTFDEEMARLRRERMEAARKTATEAALNSWDYVVLEMLRREDPRIAMKVGTMWSSESFLKLFCHGLVARLDRPATFDKLERIHALLDSAEYRQYEDRLNRLMTKDVKWRLGLVVEITGARSMEDMWDLTDEGRRALQAKRAEIIALHDRMTEQYRENRTDFYEDMPSYTWALPMMALMGLGTGAMMAYAHFVADPSHGALGGIGGPDYGDISYGVDFGSDFGF